MHHCKQKFLIANMLPMLSNVGFTDCNFNFATILFACKTSSIVAFFNDVLAWEDLGVFDCTPSSIDLLIFILGGFLLHQTCHLLLYLWQFWWILLYLCSFAYVPQCHFAFVRLANQDNWNRMILLALFWFFFLITSDIFLKHGSATSAEIINMAIHDSLKMLVTMLEENSFI